MPFVLHRNLYSLRLVMTLVFFPRARDSFFRVPAVTPLTAPRQLTPCAPRFKQAHMFSNVDFETPHDINKPRNDWSATFRLQKFRAAQKKITQTAAISAGNR